MKYLFLSLIFVDALAKEVYGPPTPLHLLAPTEFKQDQLQSNLEFKSWYEKAKENINQEDKLEWSLRPNRYITDRLKDGAVNGGLKVNDAIKEIKPNQLEGELIIRY